MSPKARSRRPEVVPGVVVRRGDYQQHVDNRCGAEQVIPLSRSTIA